MSTYIFDALKPYVGDEAAAELASLLAVGP
jgi:hypothetical protein